MKRRRRQGRQSGNRRQEARRPVEADDLIVIDESRLAVVQLASVAVPEAVAPAAARVIRPRTARIGAVARPAEAARQDRARRLSESRVQREEHGRVDERVSEAHVQRDLV